MKKLGIGVLCISILGVFTICNAKDAEFIYKEKDISVTQKIDMFTGEKSCSMYIQSAEDKYGSLLIINPKDKILRIGVNTPVGPKIGLNLKYKVDSSETKNMPIFIEMSSRYILLPKSSREIEEKEFQLKKYNQITNDLKNRKEIAIEIELEKKYSYLDEYAHPVKLDISEFNKAYQIAKECI